MGSTQDIVAKLWNLCNILRDDGITYHQYVTELTWLLFLKMAKMKWHQIGPGKVQLRLPVTAGKHVGVPTAFLCECYEKKSESYEQRMMAKFKRHMNLIALNRYIYRGAL